MDCDRVIPPPSTQTPIAIAIAIERHSTAVLDRLLSSALTAERHVMAMLKTILTDTTVRGALPIKDCQALHHILTCHVAGVIGPAGRFPDGNCHSATCSARDAPFTLSL